MNKSLPLAVALALAACSKPEAPKPAAEPAPASPPAASASAKTPEQLEKEKALASPYPNDLGPARLDDALLSSYPAEARAGYALLLERCAQCHSPARPLNSRFVEPAGKDAAVAALRKDQPELFASPEVWQIEGAVWNRYVKRMMAKPGCRISSEEGRQIWRFLVHDGERRKLGPAAAAWKAHRLKLLAEFKARHPARYAELARDKDL